MNDSILPFEQRAAFIAGPAKSGTTLLVALLDSHPELLVFPQETAYFPTVLTKYAPRGRRAQFEYLTQESLANVLFGGPPKWGKHEYSPDFPKKEFLAAFEKAAFDPKNADRDLLVIMVETYAAIRGIDVSKVKRWVEKTPANRNYIANIFARFPQAKLLVTLRDPRAILAAQIALEKTRKTRRFSAYYVIAHWRTAARLAKRVRDGELSGVLIQFEKLTTDPATMMQKVCDYLEVSFDPAVLTPTKAGAHWSGNSAAKVGFTEISTEPVSRWERELTEDEIGWIEWHCGDLMPEFGYEPRLMRAPVRSFVKPIRSERPKEYLKSRFYSLRDRMAGR